MCIICLEAGSSYNKLQKKPCLCNSCVHEECLQEEIRRFYNDGNIYDKGIPRCMECGRDYHGTIVHSKSLAAYIKFLGIKFAATIALVFSLALFVRLFVSRVSLPSARALMEVAPLSVILALVLMTVCVPWRSK